MKSGLKKFVVRALLATYQQVPSRMRRVIDADAVAKFRTQYSYDQDGLATYHSSEFLAEPKFARAYEAGRLTGSWGKSNIHWRAYTACWAAAQAMHIEGDFVECGVNRGGLARTVLEYVDLQHSGRRFFLLDTYDGLRPELLTSEERTLNAHYLSRYTSCLNDVRRTFGPFPCCVIVPGVVPDTLPQITADKIAFLSIDMNCVMPEIAAAEALWPRLSRGAIVLLDDYGWRNHKAQKRAFDQFAAERGIMVLPLPTGQGLIIRD
jgi:O-methyltransferase